MSQSRQKKQPPKELVRKWLAREVAQRRPPPDINQIRRELGWGLTEMVRYNRFR